MAKKKKKKVPSPWLLVPLVPGSNGYEACWHLAEKCWHDTQDDMYRDPDLRPSVLMTVNDVVSLFGAANTAVAPKVYVDAHLAASEDTLECPPFYLDGGIYVTLSDLNLSESMGHVAADAGFDVLTTNIGEWLVAFVKEEETENNA
jgi:hypothetical protein